MTPQNLNKRFSISSFLDRTNYCYIEDLYKDYQEDPSSICKDWHPLFLFLDDHSKNYDSLEDGIDFLYEKKMLLLVLFFEREKRRRSFF
nr:hypothetical protein [Candidatus Liberibacter africanus]